MSRLWQGVLLYQYARDPVEAVRLFDGLIEEGLSEFVPDSVVYVNASHANRDAGNLQAALDHAKEAIQRSNGSAGAYFAKAAAHQVRGELVEAEAAWDAIDSSAALKREQARLHAWAALFYLESDRARLAASQLESALLADSNWPVLALIGAWLDLRLGDYQGLESRLIDAMYWDLGQESSRIPIVDVWGIEVPVDKIVAMLQEDLGNEPKWARRVPSLIAGLLLLECQATGDCREVREAVTTGLRLEPQNQLAPLILVRLEVQEERWQEAILAIRGLPSEARTSPVFKSLQAAALLGKGRAGAAVSLLEEAFRTDNIAVGLAGRLLVQAHGQMDNWLEAHRVRDLVVQREPHDFVTASILLQRPLDSMKSTD